MLFALMVAAYFAITAGLKTTLKQKIMVILTILFIPSLSIAIQILLRL
jgi:hypothetical protein